MGASSSSCAGVKRSSAEKSQLQSKIKPCDRDQTVGDVVMLISQRHMEPSVSRCWSVARQRSVFLVDVHGSDSAMRDRLQALV